MPKHDFLTPKAISNRIKSKGLQKLRWYCQMCQKQCRDENGFKCHITSESHQRQLLLVAENPGQFIGSYSELFFRDFMQLLRLQYGTRRVLANEVYQTYIKEKEHVHMNATRWTTLTGFVMFLGREGICEAEPTEKGWYIRYIDKSPETLARQAAAEKKQKMDKDDDERIQKAIEQQIARAAATKGEEEDDEPVFTELQRIDEEEKVKFILALSNGGATSPPKSSSSSASGSSFSSNSNGGSSTMEVETGRGGEVMFEGAKEKKEATVKSRSDGSSSAGQQSSLSGKGGFVRNKPLPGKVEMLPNALKSASVASSKKKEKDSKESRKRKLTTLEEIRMMEEQKKEKKNRRDNWLAEGIVVKVLHKKLGEKFFKKKGVIVEVRDKYTGIVRMLDTGNKIKIDQAHLETVIPAIGKAVLIVNGAYRGLRAILEGLNAEHFCVSVKIDQGTARGRLVEGVVYEDISKLA